MSADFTALNAEASGRATRGGATDHGTPSQVAMNFTWAADDLINPLSPGALDNRATPPPQPRARGGRFRRRLA
jgi:hypothetical protein